MITCNDCGYVGLTVAAFNNHDCAPKTAEKVSDEAWLAGTEWTHRTTCAIFQGRSGVCDCGFQRMQDRAKETASQREHDTWVEAHLKKAAERQAAADAVVAMAKEHPEWFIDYRPAFSDAQRMYNYWQSKVAEIAELQAEPMQAPPPDEGRGLNPDYRPPNRLPEEGDQRKDIPFTEGLIDYFPDALAYVAYISKIGNDKHNPGEPLHHARGKSMDHANCIGRHLVDRGGVDSYGVRHSGNLAWRALALLQEELERDGGLTLPRGAWPA